MPVSPHWGGFLLDADRGSPWARHRGRHRHWRRRHPGRGMYSPSIQQWARLTLTLHTRSDSINCPFWIIFIKNMSVLKLYLSLSLWLLHRSTVARPPVTPTYMAAKHHSEHGSDWLSEVTPSPWIWDATASLLPIQPSVPTKDMFRHVKWLTHRVRRHAYIPSNLFELWSSFKITMDSSQLTEPGPL